MPAGPFTAGSVMDRAASLLNDTARSVYTYDAQLPYLRMAVDELQEEMQLNNVAVTNVTSQIIPVNIGDIAINPPTGSPPTYAGDLVQIQQIWERAQDSTDPFLPMVQREFLPHELDNIPLYNLGYWVWNEQIIKFNPSGALTAREVKIDYIADAIATPTDSGSPIGVMNSQSFLQFRTAALCAEFIKRDKEAADALNTNAQMAIDRLVGIDTKGRQSFGSRRRPFRASYRGRGIR